MMPANDELLALLRAFKPYAAARRTLLAQLPLAKNRAERSCRDPLAEFSEALVARLLDGELAPSPTQKGWDLKTSEDRKVQIKYLANPPMEPRKRWVNEHELRFTSDLHDYALVVYEDFRIDGVLIVPREAVSGVCRLLRKRHPKQDCTLQLTKRDYQTFKNEPSRFSGLGVKLLLPPSFDG